MSDLFLIRKGEVNLLKNDILYIDTVENFKLDGANVPDDLTEIDYVPELKQCKLNGEYFQPFPNEFAEECFTNFDTLVANKKKRLTLEVKTSEAKTTEE